MIIKFFKYSVVALVLVPAGITLFLVMGGFIFGRELTNSELDLARVYYSENLDLSKVRVAIDTIYSIFSSVTLGNRIHIKTSHENLKLLGDFSKTIDGQYLLIHELAHVYQYQNEGWSYVPKSLYAQFIAQQVTGSRNGAYNWKAEMKKNTPWKKWNPEEQAQAISDYHYYSVFGFDLNDEGKQAKKLSCFVPQLIKEFCVR